MVNLHGFVAFYCFIFVNVDDDAQSTRNIIESVVMETILHNYDRSKAIKCLTDDTVSVRFVFAIVVEFSNESISFIVFYLR